MARILVVDDEAQIRKFLRISLGACGYEVLEADCAGSGIDLAGRCLLYTSPSPRDRQKSRMPSSA